MTTGDSEVRLRLEEPGDVEAVRRVEREAFPGEDVAGLVEALREHGKLALSLVAEVGSEVVGHVSFSAVTFEPEQAGVRALQLSPLAVLPAFQGRGIGSALMREGLERCGALGVDAVFLLGHPGYYPRFGFRPAREFDVHYQDDRDAWMGIELRAGSLEAVSGRVVFEGEFEPFE